MSPLAGCTVLVTRVSDASEALAARLRELQARPLQFPLIAFKAPVNEAPLRAAFKEIDQYQWIVFTSAQAVSVFVNRKLGAELPQNLQIAAVGQATAAALRRGGLKCDHISDKASVEDLTGSLKVWCTPQDRILYLRADRVAGNLASELRAMGLHVDDPVAYRTVTPAGSNAQLLGHFEAREIDWILALSGSALENLLALVPDVALLRQARIATIGPKTSAVASAMGLVVAIQAPHPSLDSLIEALIAAQKPPIYWVPSKPLT